MPARCTHRRWLVSIAEQYQLSSSYQALNESGQTMNKTLVNGETAQPQSYQNKHRARRWTASAAASNNGDAYGVGGRLLRAISDIRAPAAGTHRLSSRILRVDVRAAHHCAVAAHRWDATHLRRKQRNARLLRRRLNARGRWRSIHQTAKT